MKKLKTILQCNYFYIILVFITIIYLIISTKIIKYDTLINSNELTGVITSISVSDDSLSFILKSSEKVKCIYYIKDNEEDYNDLLGKKVIIKGIIKEINNNTIKNTFNYKKYLYNNRIYITFKVDSIKVIEKENIFYNIKNKIINKINKYDNSVKVYLNLFILGNKDLLDSNIYDNYRNNGIWHLFAISGMHISLIISCLNKLLKRFKYKNIVISLILIYFMFLTGFSASVQRTSIFFILKTFLNYNNIYIDNKKILILTAFIILIINPFMIYNVGFQYSFLISYTIMLESKYLNGSYFKKIFIISLISFIVSMPITINMNYEINILSIILNIFYVPFISLVIFPISILSFFIPFLSIILKYLIIILEISNKYFYNLKIIIIIPKMGKLLIIIYYLILYIYYKKRKIIYLIFIIITILINIIIPKLDSNIYIHFFDVSQGDSSLIIDKYKRNVIMIDTGGLVNSDYKVSDNIITFLKSIGINKIDVFISSHGDYDHLGDGEYLINNFKVNKVIFNCGTYNNIENDLIKSLDKNNIEYDSCIKDIKYSNYELSFLNTGIYNNENDNSNIIYTKIMNYSFLFMGDASSVVENNIINNYDIKNIDVLKVGHHGSKYSSSKEFINIINPKYSVISVGKNNRYNHPNKSVLEILNNSKIYRTDIDGSIEFIIKNNNLSIKNYSL